MWKNSLLYVHDPVNQFHSEENDHHCISTTYLSLSTTTLQKFNICVEINYLEKRFQNFLYFINIRKTQMLLSRFFHYVLLYFFPLMNSLIYFDIELGIPHSIKYRLLERTTLDCHIWKIWLILEPFSRQIIPSQMLNF